MRIDVRTVKLRVASGACQSCGTDGACVEFSAPLIPFFTLKLCGACLGVLAETVANALRSLRA